MSVHPFPSKKVFRLLMYGFEGLGKPLGSNGLAIDLYSFCRLDQMRRSVEAGMKAGLLKNGRDGRAGGTFAVGPAT